MTTKLKNNAPVILSLVQQVSTISSSRQSAGCPSRAAVPWTRQPSTCTRPSARTSYHRRRRTTRWPTAASARHGQAVRPAVRPPSTGCFRHRHCTACLWSSRPRPTITGLSVTSTVARCTRRAAESPCTSRWPRRPYRSATTCHRRRCSRNSNRRNRCNRRRPPANPHRPRCRTERVARRRRATSGS